MTVDNFKPSPDFQGCGCKICKAGLGEQVNWLAARDKEIEELQEYLKTNGLEVSKKLIKKHLDHFEIKPGNPELKTPDIEEFFPTVDPISEVEILNSISFTDYNFNENIPEEVIAYLQKIALKIHMGTSALAIRDIQYAQNSGGELEPNSISNWTKTQKALAEITAIDMMINQQKAIRTVEGLGLRIDNSNSLLPPANLSRPVKSDIEKNESDEED